VTTWIPIGPDSVFTPRDGNFQRLSRRDELGRQSLVNSVAIDPNDASTVYTTETPTSGGNSSFRTDDDGESWAPIVDGLQQTDPAGVNPSCIAVHPTTSGVVYLGTFSGRVYTSTTSGQSWSGPATMSGAAVRKLIVDPTTASDPTTTVVYAASDDGVWRSADGGNTFTQVLSGGLSDLAARFPSDGSASDFYAGVIPGGIYHSSDPTDASAWTDLTSQPGSNLPAVVAGTPAQPNGNFDAIRLGVCQQTSRVYAWFFNTVCDASGSNCHEQTASLYTAATPTSAWSEITMTSPPGPSYGLYGSLFSVAPNSPGDGQNDVLFFGAIDLFRSIDSGGTWGSASQGAITSDEYHADYHTIAYYPAAPSAGTIPAMFVGCDGGLGVSTGIADPAVSLTEPPGAADELTAYTNSAVVQNYGHGKQSSAIYRYGSDPSIAALGYIGCQDTGVNAGDSALLWRGIYNADGGGVAARQGADGVKVWCRIGEGFYMYMATDKGEYSPGIANVVLPQGRPVDGPSNYVVDANGNCIAGIIALTPPGTSIAAAISSGVRTVAPGSMAFIELGTPLQIKEGGTQETVIVTAVTGTTFTADFANGYGAGASANWQADTSVATPIAAGTQAVTPGSMAGISIGSSLNIDTGSSQETVTVTAVTATTFTADFGRAHAAGAWVRINHGYLARIDQNANATVISQDFGQVVPVAVAAHPTNADVVFMATSDQRLWGTSNATGTTPTWTQVSGNDPTSGGAQIASISIDPSGNVFVLLNEVVASGGDTPIASPLFLISGSSWVQLACAGLPAATGGGGFGRLVADPLQANTLYAGYDARVYRLTSRAAQGVWSWTDISTGLPGQWIYDLWAGQVANAGARKALLRAAIPTRGMWELDITAGASDQPLVLYVRDNLLDTGLFPTSPDGVANPYDPGNPGATLYHYQCADVKVDAQQPGSSASPPFFQTDPEGTLPLSHVLFDQLKDNSQHLPGAGQAMVHVQVRNRGTQTANNVRVWAVYCNASAGVPALSESASYGNNFPFWGQFLVTGQIIPTLPADSPWTAIGAPQVLSGIAPASPQVASWTWTVPRLSANDPGHYCIVVFVHSSASPLAESSYDVDVVTPRNKQIGQKNLHIGPALPAGSGGGGGGGGGEPGGTGAGGGSPGSRGEGPGGGGAGDGAEAASMTEYVEFHNPTSAARQSTFVLDLRGLPPELRVSFLLTEIDTVNPLTDSLTGVHQPGHPHSLPGALGEWADRIANELEEAAATLLRELGRLLEEIGDRLGGRPSHHRHEHSHLPRFNHTVYTALPSARVAIAGVNLAAMSSEAMLISIENRGSLPPGSEYTFQVQQFVAGELVGGSAFVVRIAGVKVEEPFASPSLRGDLDVEEVEELEVEGVARRHLPPWMAGIVAQSEQNLRKKTS
jgi:hypothetical protein